LPSLQFDLPLRMTVEMKKALAKEVGAIYAEVMQVRAELVTISVHDLGPGGVWRCGNDDPEPAGLVMCDVRAGRSSDTRALLARRIVDVCVRLCGLDADRLKVEFTQHTGDEMFHPHLGGFNTDWHPGEGHRPSPTP
jgi:phenylpyruvate tautomerase PptA (4-oxalocrotonate tautomerase family)